MRGLPRLQPPKRLQLPSGAYAGRLRQLRALQLAAKMARREKPRFSRRAILRGSCWFLRYPLISLGFAGLLVSFCETAVSRRVGKVGRERNLQRLRSALIASRLLFRSGFFERRNLFHALRFSAAGKGFSPWPGSFRPGKNFAERSRFPFPVPRPARKSGGAGRKRRAGQWSFRASGALPLVGKRS